MGETPMTFYCYKGFGKATNARHHSMVISKVGWLVLQKSWRENGAARGVGEGTWAAPASGAEMDMHGKGLNRPCKWESMFFFFSIGLWDYPFLVIGITGRNGSRTQNGLDKWAWAWATIGFEHLGLNIRIWFKK